MSQVQLQETWLRQCMCDCTHSGAGAVTEAFFNTSDKYQITIYHCNELVLTSTVGVL
jgi:hypothetical protein